MSVRPAVTPDWLRSALSSIFTSAGLPSSAARTVAESLVSADMRGVPSHGALLVPMYVDRLRQGSVSVREAAEVVIDLGAIAVLDAHHAFGQVTGDQAIDLAVSKAKVHGIGAVVVRRAFHFGGAFRYVEAAALQGCIGIAAANTRPLMPAPGGAEAVVGNNPIAVGVPVAGRAPMVLDMALSEAALGKIRLASQEGREIPPTWATDAAGAPTTDPTAAIAGLLLPAAGHKGYGLALVIDMLTGLLSGGSFGRSVQGLYADTSVPNDCAHFFLAIDVSKFGDPTEFLDRAAALVGDVLASQTAPGVERVLLPGQLEGERHAHAERNGIELDVSALQAIRDTAEQVGVVLPEIPATASDLQYADQS